VDSSHQLHRHAAHGDRRATRQHRAGLRYYVEKPAGGPDWRARLIFTMLFPKK
jgi:hypothetical protein